MTPSWLDPNHPRARVEYPDQVSEIVGVGRENDRVSESRSSGANYRHRCIHDVGSG